jgi:hypothetical protein
MERPPKRARWRARELIGDFDQLAVRAERPRIRRGAALLILQPHKLRVWFHASRRSP